MAIEVEVKSLEHQVVEVGGVLTTVTIFVEDDQPSPSPIDGVAVRVYDADDNFITEGTTGAGADPAGTFTLILTGTPSPGTNYIIRLSQDGTTFVNGPTQLIMVLDPLVPPDTNVFEFVGTIPVTPTATDPDLCRVYGDFRNISLEPAKGMVLEFKPIPVFSDPGGTSRLLGAFNSQPALLRTHILTRGKKVMVEDDGSFCVDLPREGCFKVHIHGFEDPIEIVEFLYVPDAASCSFIDLLYPYVSAFSFDDNPVAVGVGATLEVPFTLAMSNGQTIEDLDVLSDLLDFTIADETIVEVTLFSSTSVTVKGLQAGATTIDVTRNGDNVVPSRPPISALVVTSLAVTVS